MYRNDVKMISPKIRFNCLPTVIGSMPHKDAREACRLMLKYIPAIPVWPQLPNRSPLESMYVQYGEGFPGIKVEGDSIYIKTSDDLDSTMEKLHNAHFENDTSDYAITPQYAAGLHELLNMNIHPPLAVKGQIIGPISWGLTVTDGLRYIIYDDTLAEAMTRHLRLKASWQQKALTKISPNTIIFLDEPSLSSLGSPFVSLSSDKAAGLMTETLEGISGIKGLHCCGNADWPMVLNLPIDILNFDAYNYTNSLSTYPAEVKSFLERGGTIAWGIIPNDEDTLSRETLASLIDRFEEGLSIFHREGIQQDILIHQGLITPSCGLASLSVDAAEQALKLLAEVSASVRKRYVKLSGKTFNE